AIYEEVGRRGSRTTLNKHLRTFLEDFGKRGLSALPSAIPEDLIPIVKDFWAQALVQAGKRYEKERVRWQDDLTAKDQAMDDLKAVIAER
ncbi:DNA-binding protein, partial [Priestia megaterium]|uniref:DNA-binding protein n=1 Tax=Priestia megaterium TaxID=1404 RepID=UPI0035B656B3